MANDDPIITLLGAVVMDGDNGVRKAAILLTTLGVDLAVQVLQHLSEHEIEIMAKCLAGLRRIEEGELRKVINEATRSLKTGEHLPKLGLDALKMMLDNLLGPAKAAEILRRAMGEVPEEQPSILETLRRYPASRLLELIRNETPQAIALLLAYLSPAQAVEVLMGLPHGVRNEAMLRLLMTDVPPQEGLQALEVNLREMLAPSGAQEVTFSGMPTVIRILNNAPQDLVQDLLRFLDSHDSQLAEQVRQALFTFEDLVRLDDRSIQRLLREIETHQLAVALRGASSELREKVFKNMSERAAAILREEMELMGPVRLREVQDAQRQILSIVQKLEELGEIIIPRGEEEVLV